MPEPELIDQFISYISSEKRYSAHTAKSYRNDLLDLNDFLSTQFDTVSFFEVSHAMIRSWLASLKERKMEAKSINRKLSSARSFFKYLLRQKMIINNPAHLIPSLKQKRRLPVFVEQKGIDELLNRKHFPESFDGSTAFLVIALLYSTGMRLSELIHLSENDVDRSNAILKVLGKGNKQRNIPLKPAVIKLIDDYILEKDKICAFETTSLLITKSGKPLYPVFVQRLIRKYLDEITTISKKSPHVLRHTFATHLSNNGAPINAIKDLLGHESLAATQIYTHAGIEQLKEVHRQAHPKS